MYTVHEASGLPWWATIAVTTFTVRLALFPLTVMQSRSVATMSKIRPKMDALTAKMKAASERAGGRGMEDAEKARLELQQLFATHNVRPWMTFVGALGQLPVWLTFFFTMRDITGRPGNALGMEDGGALWFTDLTTRDPTYGLPVLCGATFFAMVHLGDAGQTGKVDDKTALMKNVMKGVAVLMVPMTSWFEAGVFVYWISSNLCAMSQTVLLKQPAVRAAVGMPPVAAVLSAPASTLSGAGAVPATPYIPAVTYTAPPATGALEGGTGAVGGEAQPVGVKKQKASSAAKGVRGKRSKGKRRG